MAMKMHPHQVEELIRLEAYLLSEKAGHPHGMQATFWEQAEDIVRSRAMEVGKPKTATPKKAVAAKKKAPAKPVMAKAPAVKAKAPAAVPAPAKAKETAASKTTAPQSKAPAKKKPITTPKGKPARKVAAAQDNSPS